MYVCMGASISVLYKIVVFMNQLTDAAKEQALWGCRPRLLNLLRMRKHNISVLELQQMHTCTRTHTHIQIKCINVFISIRWHLLATNMREERSTPLANLSAVNYGNLPSCLSAFAAGLPFMSKSKAGICNTGTFPFLQGHALHKCLMMGDIYSILCLVLPLQTPWTNTHITEYEQTQKHPQLCLGGKAKSFWDSSTSFHFYISCDFTILVGVYALWALLYSVYQRHSDCRRFQIRRFECKHKVFEYSCISIEIIYGLLLFLDSLFLFF